MSHAVEAIFFDVNGTLRHTTPADQERSNEKLRQILDLLGESASAEDLSRLLTGRMQAYRGWARAHASELSETELWTRWLLPDRPAQDIQRLAPRLHQLWRDATGIRMMEPAAAAVLTVLFRRGYRLGIASNTLGQAELMSALRNLGISGCFETVVLSSHIGARKPDPAILLEAASRLSIEPSNCAYVGNRLDRDVAAARAAGFARTVIVSPPPGDAAGAPALDGSGAATYIEGLAELLDVFPPVQPSVQRTAYRASFSTMWARRNLSHFGDFFESSRRLGFAAVELNHQVDSSMLAGIDLQAQPVSSVHEPCPADVSTEQLKERDWLISSPDEECRQHGVDAIKRSIDLAKTLHLPVIVVHCGMNSVEMKREARLRELLKVGGRTSDEYRAIQAELIRARRELAGPHMDAVVRSLHELLRHTGDSGIVLGLENRYHFFDIPSLGEMAQLLGLADAARLGFVYDVGHAQTLDRLGFYPHEEWLRRYSSRMVEVHLHDVQGTDDHLAPGLGEVDFDMVASYLPKAAIRTLELQGSNTPDQVRAGLQHLAQHGCIEVLG